jgi:CubicO group peptidase (beta-lactamase class C family)
MFKKTVIKIKFVNVALIMTVICYFTINSVSQNAVTQTKLRSNESVTFLERLGPFAMVPENRPEWDRVTLVAPRVYSCPPCGCEAHQNTEKAFGTPGACSFCQMPLFRKIESARKAKEAEVSAELKFFLESLERDDEFSGAVLLAKHGQIFFTGAYGKANKSFNAPNQLDTKFNLGSMNKMFTAVAIAQLAEAGKLSFDDPLARFLPNALPKIDAQKIKIKHLLTHTSGLGDYIFTPEMEKLSTARFRSVDDWMGRVKDDTLAFEPGTSWHYSNTGYLVLGKVIEQITGLSYFDYIRKYIYSPVGMINTDSYEADKVVPNLSIGYSKVGTSAEGGWRNNLFSHVVKGGPAGGGYSTVEDLFKFAIALRSGKLVSKPFVDLLMSPKTELNSPNYGYGFEIARGRVGHGGAAPGISSTLVIYPDEGYVVVVLSNYDFGYFPATQAVQDLLPLGAAAGR